VAACDGSIHSSKARCRKNYSNINSFYDQRAQGL
jgi:hypothetical protein